MRKIFCLGLVTLVCFFVSYIGMSGTAFAEETPPESQTETPNVSQYDTFDGFFAPRQLKLYSQGAAFVDLTSGEILFSKNADLRLQPAQLCNIMTAIIVLEECENLDTLITADYNLFTEFHSYDTPSDLTYGMIDNGDKFSVRDYLCAMMLQSSIEAANILADYFGNGLIGFAMKMNQKAAELGCTNTNFVNAHGLYNAAQFTTARDMAIIARYAWQNAKFIEISSTLNYAGVNRVSGQESKWRHTNLMLFESDTNYYKGAKGIKTGNLRKFGRNLITACSLSSGNAGYSYMAVLLGAPIESGVAYPHISDAKKLFDWAGTHLSIKNVITKGELITEMKVKYAGGTENFALLEAASTYSLLWSDEIDISTVERKVSQYPKAVAPIEKEQVLGTVELRMAGRALETVDLVSQQKVERSGVEFNKKAVSEFARSKQFKRGFFIIIGFTVLYAALSLTAFVLVHKQPNKARQFRRKQRRK